MLLNPRRFKGSRLISVQTVQIAQTKSILFHSPKLSFMIFRFSSQPEFVKLVKDKSDYQ